MLSEAHPPGEETTRTGFHMSYCRRLSTFTLLKQIAQIPNISCMLARVKNRSTEVLVLVRIGRFCFMLFTVSNFAHGKTQRDFGSKTFEHDMKTDMSLKTALFAHAHHSQTLSSFSFSE